MAGNPEYTGGRLKQVFNLPSKAELGGGGRGGWHTYKVYGLHWKDSGWNGLGDVLVEHFARQEEVK